MNADAIRTESNLIYLKKVLFSDDVLSKNTYILLSNLVVNIAIGKVLVLKSDINNHLFQVSNH